MVYQQHLDGINRSCLGRRKGIGAATVQRYFERHLQRRARQDHPVVCPKILGIDEHFFTRKKGYATTLCDLKNHRIYDITLGRSEAALESYFLRLRDRPRGADDRRENGGATGLFRTLKEQLLWVRRFRHVEELRAALIEFRDRYGHYWIVQRLGYRTPAQARRDYSIEFQAAA